MTIRIYNPYFKGADLQGSGKITNSQILHSANLKLNLSGAGKIDLIVATPVLNSNISGSGKIVLTGIANCASHTISGSGKIAAFALNSDNVNANVSGSGTCEVFVNQFLEATISGSGNVVYKGTPVVTTHISGSGNVKAD